MSPQKHALFPLNTVLFPGGILPLQIFEQRYLQLIKDCMKNNQGFVVVLIGHGKEVADTPEVYRIGTYAEITDWQTLKNSLLGITIEGRYRVKIHDIAVRDDGLVTGNTTELDITESSAVIAAADIDYLTDTLNTLIKHPFAAERYADFPCSSINDICHRLSELLPISNQERQSLLEILDIKQQAEKLVSYIHTLEN